MQWDLPEKVVLWFLVHFFPQHSECAAMQRRHWTCAALQASALSRKSWKVINHEYCSLLPRARKNPSCMEQVQVNGAHSKSLRGIVGNYCCVFKTEKRGRWFKKTQAVSHQVGEIKAGLLCTLAYSYQCYIRVICYRLSLLIEYTDYI